MSTVALAADHDVGLLAEPPDAAFQTLTFPRHRPLLDRIGDPGVIAVAVRDGWGRPAGLLLAEVQGRLALLQSIFVRPAARRRGLARAMIGRFRSEGYARGAYEGMTVWTTKAPGFEAFEALLGSAGWLPPRPRVCFCEGDPIPMARSPWFLRTPAPEPPYSIAPWTSVTAAEMAAIAAGESGAPDVLQPIFRMEHLEAAVSQVLRHDGRIVGWSLVHDFPERPEALIHSRSWCRPEHSAGARGLAVIVAGVRAQIDLRPDRPVSVFDVPVVQERMLRIYRKRIQPFGSLTYESRQSGVLLIPDVAV